jgi:hypothetical protein
MSVQPRAERWAETPPSWALPVTIAGDLILVSEGGVLMSVGAICAYPVGFTFYLTFGFDPLRAARMMGCGPGRRLLGFHARTPQEQESVTRIVITFPGGTMADSVACLTGPPAPGEPLLRFCGGDSVIQPDAPVLRAESRWWVSPLPPAGPVMFSVFLPGAAEPDGAESIDSARILEAAARSPVLWPCPGTDAP